MEESAAVWLRSTDLRIADNPALYHAYNNHRQVQPFYILHEDLGEAAAWWQEESLRLLTNNLAAMGVCLLITSGDPLSIMQQIPVQHIYWNRRYEPALVALDQQIETALADKGIKCHTMPGNLLQEPWTIRNNSNSYFKVFTPYWKKCLDQDVLAPLPMPALRPTAKVQWQFTNYEFAHKEYKNWAVGEQAANQVLQEFITQRLADYGQNRDRPDIAGTSVLSPYLRFGEIGVRQIWHALGSLPLSASVQRFMAELGWREFSYHLLHHFPQLPTTNFRPEFDRFRWHNDSDLLAKWQQGETGYPIVDAGMKQLLATGWMHNRVRMIVASFLTKDLLIDWRLGASWFWDKLVDADLANNSASWQWVAGCGADAAPYFRIFNPVLQAQRFDPQGIYIKTWLPQLQNVAVQNIHQPNCTSYIPPLVDHAFARKMAMMLYQDLTG